MNILRGFAAMVAVVVAVSAAGCSHSTEAVVTVEKQTVGETTGTQAKTTSSFTTSSTTNIVATTATQATTESATQATTKKATTKAPADAGRPNVNKTQRKTITTTTTTNSTRATTKGSVNSTRATTTSTVRTTVPTAPPVQENKRYKSADGQWAINNLCDVQGDRVTVAAKNDGTAAFYAGQSLGSSWSASADFTPVLCYTEDQPICTRLFVNNAQDEEALLLTVNVFSRDGRDKIVEISLQTYDGKRWRSLYNTNGWIPTESTSFSFGMRREEGSSKIHFTVSGDQGVLVDQDTLFSVSEDILDSVMLAGFGAYNSRVEFSRVKVTGNGPSSFAFGDLQF